MKRTAPPSRGIDETNVSTEQQTTQTNARVSGSHGDSGRPTNSKAAARQGTQAPDGDHTAQATRVRRAPSRRFPRSARVRKRSEFLRIQRSGRRRAGACFVVLTEPSRTGVSRLGITVSRRVGDAVTRNRVKRLIREFFRHYRHRLEPPQDVLVISRNTAARASYTTVKTELGRALKIDVAG